MSTPQPQQQQQPPMNGQRLPPAGAQKDPEALAVATALRYNKLLKQRQGIVTNTKNRSDFFRFKRFERAILSEEYSKKMGKTPILPKVSEKQQVQQVFIKLIQNQLVLPVTKLKTKDAKAKGISIDKKTPALELTNKAALKDDEYYVWNFNPPNPYLILYTILALILVFALILFPLWPFWMRKGVWYLSNLALGLISLFFGLAIVRLVVYLITLVGMKDQLWIFPNLFADCGVLESFQPTYEWAISGSEKKKSSKKHKLASEPTSAPLVPTTTTSSTKITTGSTGVSSETKPTKRVATLEEIQDE